MKVVFLSNYFNHHQEPFSLAMHALTGGEYAFVATETVSEERVKLGYEDMNKKYPWIVRAYESEEEKKALEYIDDADLVIVGSAPDRFIRKRLQENKLVFRYSERICKKKQNEWIMLLRRIKHFLMNWRARTVENYYLLCSSAYTAADYRKLGGFSNRTYKWGYFPAVKAYADINELVQNKKKNSLLWVGRFLDWKHPDAAIEVAKRLQENGYDFEMNIVGAGEMEETLKSLIQDYGLESKVKMLGSKPASEVRAYMEQAEIYLFTSDRGEGWGAVLNESMNSGCAVVASHAIGSVPFLVNDGKNGYIYKDGDIDDLYKKVKRLLDEPSERRAIGINAYETMKNEWNAENAAKKLLVLAALILKGEKHPYPFGNGVCSKAEILKDEWYK